MANFKHPETIGLHGGEYRSDPATTAVAVPIYQTSSYQFKNAETAANLFGLKEFGNIYTRIMNPTCDVLEKRVAALESGLAAVAVGSGQAASAFCVQNVAQAGDNIVASTDLYGGTVNLFKNTLRQQGIEVRFADPADPKNFEKLTDDKTRAYYGESCPNPYLRVFPIKEVADIGKKKGIPLIIDNTASPVICKPLTHGAAIVCHSLTKYIGGHGTSIGGIIVDGGNFDWTKDRKRQPLMNEPDQSYGGAIWADAVPQLTGANIPFAIRARVVLLRDLGAPLSPFNAFQIIQGLETVALRMKQHCASALQIAKWLETQNGIQKVIYPGLPSHPQHDIASRQMMLDGSVAGGGMITFILDGGLDASKTFLENVSIFSLAESLGGVESLIEHPAIMTHASVEPEVRQALGIDDGLIRISVGIEHFGDLIADLEHALSKCI